METLLDQCRTDTLLQAGSPPDQAQGKSIPQVAEWHWMFKQRWLALKTLWISAVDATPLSKSTPMLCIIILHHSAISNWTVSREVSLHFTHPSWVLYCVSVLHYQPDYVQRFILIRGLLTHHTLLEPPRFKETWEECSVLGLTHIISHSELAFWVHKGSAYRHGFHQAACGFDMEGTDCTQSNTLL